MLKISPFRCQYGLTDPYLVTGKKVSLASRVIVLSP